jgi:hypothetical protein
VRRRALTEVCRVIYIYIYMHYHLPFLRHSPVSTCEMSFRWPALPLSSGYLLELSNVYFRVSTAPIKGTFVTKPRITTYFTSSCTKKQPPRSPDLNPCGLRRWELLKSMKSATLHTLTDLKEGTRHVTQIALPYSTEHHFQHGHVYGTVD